MVHEDTPHQPRRHREKVRAVLPVHLLDIDEPQVGLVDERRGLQAMAAPFTAHASPGDLLQLPLHERNHPAEGRLVAVSPREQQLGDLGWMGRHWPPF